MVIVHFIRITVSPWEIRPASVALAAKASARESIRIAKDATTLTTALAPAKRRPKKLL